MVGITTVRISNGGNRFRRETGAFRLLIKTKAPLGLGRAVRKIRGGVREKGSRAGLLSYFAAFDNHPNRLFPKDAAHGVEVAEQRFYGEWQALCGRRINPLQNQRFYWKISRFLQLGGVTLTALALAGCAAFGSGGPRTGQIKAADQSELGGSRVRVIQVDDTVARRLAASNHRLLLSEALGDATPVGTVVGFGDVLEVAIWEAPPAALFGASSAGFANAASASSFAANAATGHGSSLPEQMVDENGRITVPFAGQVPAVGRRVSQIASDIAARLKGIANQPQVIVRIVRNANANVTVVGEVTTSTRLSLTPRGERVLDALAVAGGVRQPVNKMTLQVTRGRKTAALPLETIIKDPSQNIRLAADDVVTALYQPYSFTALGAAGANAEINFEGTGLTLSQALGRMGGLRDERANPKGVFIFRLEDPAALGDGAASAAAGDNRIPVIFRVDFANPTSFFVAQSFPIRNHDVIYVSNAPMVDFQKFVVMVSQLAITGLSISNSAP